MTWKYKIDLKDENVFTKIENIRNINISDEFKQLIIAANGATPEKYKFMVGTNERVLGAILSFNENEKDTDTVYTALNVIEDKNLLPFGIDPFGNYICLDINDNQVVFWDHESESTSSTFKNLGSFINELY